MAIELKVPQISEGVDSATISEILVSKGDKIEEDQRVIAVETDKASTEIPSTSAGTVKEIKVNEGDEVNVGDVILVLEEDEDNSEETQNKEESSEDIEKEEQEKTSTSDKEEDKEKPEDEKKKKTQDKSQDKEKKSDELEKNKGEEKSSEKSGKKSSDKKKSSKEVYASPGVRRIARELDVDIQDIEGSGKSGRITEKDVREHKEGSKEKSTAEKHPKLPDFSQWGAIETKPLNNIKKTTAKNVLESWQTIPHVFQFGEADISGIENYIVDHKKEIEKAGGKLTLTAILTKIIASALHKFPMFNASIDMENEEMILKKYVNINIAVDTDKGLLVPVIKKVDQKSIKDLSIEISEIAQKAREQELSNEDMEGGNFSISNLGGIGGTNFTPIVYHPQVAILGVSQARIRPVYINDEFKPRSVLPLSLSYDHRLIDGADGALFMNWIVKALENPYEALLS